MHYNRVLPRDFFNEAKLLKCMGQLSLKVLDGLVPNGVFIQFDECDDPFQIDLTECGHLWIKNYKITINGVEVKLKIPYNSKQPYPLLCELDYEDTPVFTDHGVLTREFVDRFNEKWADD